jgi:glycosyltransferase involved in cell wall biosynthesis
MKLTLIITTYNWPESLLLVIKSIRHQSIIPDEIIIADDGSTKETKAVIDSFMGDPLLEIIHSWHEDKGFRASRSRNNAILKSSGEYIILVDGDTILHTDFIKDHIKHAEPGFFAQGYRVLLSEKQTEESLIKANVSFSFFSSQFKNRKNSIHSNFLSFIFSTKKNHLQGVKSCNMGFYKKDCMKINGFNNAFEGWGREDTEFIVRMINSGINRKNIRFNAIQFHLWHNENSRGLLERNNAILEDTINNSTKWCTNGINSIQ